MILRIDHIGVATDDPVAMIPFLNALGMTATASGSAPAYGVSCQFWQIADGTGGAAVELVTPVADGSVREHLRRQGPGPYHLALEVDSVDAELTRLRTHGFVPVDRVPCAGARPGMWVAFMYLPRPAGLLVELVEYR